ncbi:hypothetical protein CK911_15290 [Aeromonas sp. CU5]|uniref:hypothetical protein n=1 Tax=Aeromonas sp. CU5 TaxID=2033033 RepID=UPI000BFCB6B6|nr:hypothetical protein [Aeromonas sp. CU5]ATL94025.1 hypothetical protein CK911_15290 [Aeromonas sp. CU5]
MSDQYINSDFLEGLVVWQKSPDDEPIIVNEEEGIPYFSPNGRPRLAITKDGQLIDSVSIDITAKKVTSDDEVERQNDQCHIGSWENKTPRLMVTRKAIKRAMGYSAKLRKIGWTDERLKLELSCLAQRVTDPSAADQLVAAICTRNRISPQQDDIPLLAVEAYEHYQGFGPRKGFKVPLKKINEGELADTVMRLALYIALINPCLGRPWGKQYTRQGHRSSERPKTALEMTLESLEDRLTDLFCQQECNDLHDEWYRDEISSLEISIASIRRDIQIEAINRMAQPDAVKAAKIKLMALGIECETKTMAQEWTQFIAKAWGVTPSNVVSAAKQIDE